MERKLARKKQGNFRCCQDATVVEPAPGEHRRSTLVFSDKSKVTTLYSLRTLRSRLQQAKLLAGEYASTQGFLPQLLREAPGLAPGRVVYLLPVADGLPLVLPGEPVKQ